MFSINNALGYTPIKDDISNNPDIGRMATPAEMRRLLRTRPCCKGCSLSDKKLEQIEAKVQAKKDDLDTVKYTIGKDVLKGGSTFYMFATEPLTPPETKYDNKEDYNNRRTWHAGTIHCEFGSRGSANDKEPDDASEIEKLPGMVARHSSSNLRARMLLETTSNPSPELGSNPSPEPGTRARHPTPELDAKESEEMQGAVGGCSPDGHYYDLIDVDALRISDEEDTEEEDIYEPIGKRKSLTESEINLFGKFLNKI